MADETEGGWVANRPTQRPRPGLQPPGLSSALRAPTAGAAGDSPVWVLFYFNLKPQVRDGALRCNLCLR